MLWVYAIVDADSDVRCGDGLPVDLRTIPSGSVAAVAQDVAAPHALTLDALREHDAVVRGLAASVPSVLPARFGQTAANDDALARRLADDRARLVESLERVRGCLQVTVQIHGNVEAREVEANPPDAVDAVDTSLGAGRRYLRRRWTEQRSLGLDELRLHVRPFVRETRSRLGPKPALASAYHLVPKTEIGGLLAAARDFVPPGDLRLRVGEPAPVYAFATPARSLG